MDVSSWMTVVPEAWRSTVVLGATLSIAVVVALVLHAVLVPVLRGLLEREADFTAAEAKRLKRPTRLLLVALALWFTLGPQADDMITTRGRQIALVIGILASASTVLALLHGAAAASLRQYPMDMEDNLEARRLATQITVLRRAAAVLVVILAAATALMVFPEARQVGVSLFASAGVAGLVIGMAARPVLANLIAGVQIALTQPIRMDDVVIVDGEWGRIEEIHTTFVVVRVWDMRRLIVPLSTFTETSFQNWTHTSSQLIGSVFWHVDYTVPVEEVRAKLDELVKDNPLWDGELAKLQVTETNDRTMTLRAIVTAKDASKAWDLRCDLREKMLVWLQQAHPQALPRVRAEVDDLRSTDAEA